MKTHLIIVMTGTLLGGHAVTFGQGVTDQTVTVPTGKYAAFIVPDPGAPLTLTINAANGFELKESHVVPSDTGDANLWSPWAWYGSGPHVYTSGTILSSREWLRINGTLAASGSGGGGGGSKPPEFNIDVPAVDIDVEGVAEEDEESVGGFVVVNSDDDNGNNKPDNDPTETLPVGNENDLVKVTISKVNSSERFKTGDVVLRVTPTDAVSGTAPKIKCWTTHDKAAVINLTNGEISFPVSKLPTNIWVEGLMPSGAAKDIELKVSYTEPSENKTTEDIVKLTVFKMTLKSISFLDAGTGAGGDNEHDLQENSTADGGWGIGSAIVDPVWVADGADADTDPDKNFPVCYTRTITGTPSKMKCNLVVNLTPAGLKFDFIGMDGATEYFKKTGETATGADQSIGMLASQELPSTVAKLEKTIEWKLVLTDLNSSLSHDVVSSTHTIYVVFNTPIQSVQMPDGTAGDNKLTPKRLDFCITKANTTGRSSVHGTDATSIARQLQGHIAINVFAQNGAFQQNTPSPIWLYIKTKEDGAIPKADCIQQSCMLAAALGQLGIEASGDRAWATSDNNCSVQEQHSTVAGRVLRYVTYQNSDDTSTTGGAYLNNFQATAWVKDENNAVKYYTMWPYYPPRDSLLAVLQYERDALDNDADPDTKFLQYWSYDGDPALDPNRFVDETLHPKRPAANWPPVWNNPVALP